MLACLAELALVLLAALLAWLFGLDLRESINPPGRQLQAVGIGLVATVPMILFLVWLQRTGWPPLAGLREQAAELVSRLLEGASAGPILLLAIMAGVGEEILFRGALQPLLGGWLKPLAGPWGGVLAAGVLFGLAHPMSRAYIVVATIGGIYLGALALVTGEVLSAIVCHAAYDVVALFWLRAKQ